MVRFVLMLVVLAFLGAKVGTANAQITTAEAALQARQSQLLVATLNDPTNLDIAFEYALVSTQLGDFEAAISTLERMLIFAPNLARVKLELVALYYRIGAIEKARLYAESVAAQDLPPEVRARLNAYEAGIDRQGQRFAVSGFASAGMQFQTNPNSGIQRGQVILNNVSFNVNDDARASSDFNTFGLVDLTATYDLYSQGDYIEANFTSFNTTYVDQSRLNYNYAGVAVGPTFQLARFGLDNAFAGLFASGGIVALGNDYYSNDFGIGARLRGQPLPRLAFESRYELSAVNYSNTPNYPTIRGATGVRFQSRSRASYTINPQLLVGVGWSSAIVDARDNFRSYKQFGLSGFASYALFGPRMGIFTDDQPWRFSVNFGGLLRDFDGPDPAINANSSQEDNVYFVGGTIKAPLPKQLSAFVASQFRQQYSNYDTREFSNFTVSAGLERRF